MKVNRTQFMEDGYLVLREVVPAGGTGRTSGEL